jgi:eukaryotic-like serine/threonine-protein kinase
VQGVTALLAGLMDALRRLLATDVCPGSWPWAVTALGIGVGLLPAVGAVIVALLRKRIGSRYGAVESVVLAATGIVTAGLLPLLVFTAAGRVFSAAAAGSAVAGLSRAGVRELRTDACFVIGTQAEYLGLGTVADAFGGGTLRLALALFLLVLAPVVTTLFVLVHARLALRRGPRWPSKFFWLPIAAVALLTAGVPAGTAGHLWLGAGVGAFLGIFVVLIAGTPSHAVVHRSLAPREPARRLAATPGPAPQHPPARRPAESPAPAAPKRSERLAERFAARSPEPPVVPAPRSGRPHQPTLVAAPPFPVSAPAANGTPRFHPIRRLGSGGFGRVWLAQDTKLGHVVALKAAHAPDAETEQRIQREARALAAVRHPHCVRIHDLVPARSDPGLAELDGMVIVMGYVEGSSLGDLVRSRGPVDDVAAARIWLSLAGALDAAHQRGVLHRDVKPGNVVVDPGGFAHLIDFGIARKSGDATMTQTGFVLGTPDFLSPEAACGERATPASDSWQLAATVSYALTGHPPRGGHADAVSGLRAAASGAALSHLPRRTAHLALLQAAMDNDPRQRPALADVQRALADWLQRVGAGVAGPVTAATRVQ